MSRTAPQTYEIVPGDTVNIAVNLSGFLTDDETITGTPTLGTVDGVTFTNARANTEDHLILLVTVPAGKAVLFVASVASDAATGCRAIPLTFSTSEGQTMTLWLQTNVVTAPMCDC